MLIVWDSFKCVVHFCMNFYQGLVLAYTLQIFAIFDSYNFFEATVLRTSCFGILPKETILVFNNFAKFQC